MKWYAGLMIGTAVPFTILAVIAIVKRARSVSNSELDIGILIAYCVIWPMWAGVETVILKTYLKYSNKLSDQFDVSDVTS